MLDARWKEIDFLFSPLSVLSVMWPGITDAGGLQGDKIRCLVSLQFSLVLYLSKF